MRRHGRWWRQIVHVRVVSAVVLVMVRRRVMVMWMMVMWLVMMVMGRVAIPAGATVRRVTSTGAHGRRPAVVVVQVHQARWRFRDCRTPYRSRCVTSTTCTHDYYFETLSILEICRMTGGN